MEATMAQQFVDDVLRQMWPKWEPTDWEVGFWLRVLARYDYAGSLKGLEGWFSETTKPGTKPVVGVFNRVAVADKDLAPPPEPVLLFGLAQLGKLDEEQKFYISSPPIPVKPEIERLAEKARDRAEEIYGGDWVIVRHWDQDDTPLEDDGLQGEEALKRAEDIILAGPDTPGKKFLLEHGRSKDIQEMVEKAEREVDKAVADPREKNRRESNPALFSEMENYF